MQNFEKFTPGLRSKSFDSVKHGYQADTLVVELLIWATNIVNTPKVGALRTSRLYFEWLQGMVLFSNSTF